MLLRANNHAGTHESHVRNNFVGSEAVTVDEISADKTSSATKSSLAVNCNVAVLDSDGAVGEVDEFPDHGKGWTCSVVKDHVNVVDAHGGKIVGGIELGVEADNKANVAGIEVVEDILEGRRKVEGA